MFKSTLRAALLAVFVAALAQSAFGEVVEDFEGAPAWSVYKGEERGGSVTIAPAPGTSGRALRLDFRANRADFLEPIAADPKVIRTFAEKREGMVSVRVYTEVGCPASGIALRLVDSQGEVFQWSAPLTPAGGWQDITFQVSPQTVNGASWGDRKNGIMDLPMRFLGFAVTLDKTIPVAGSVYLADVRATGSGRKAAMSRPLWRFDHFESWRLGSGGPEAARLDPGGDGLILTCLPAAKTLGFPLLESGFGLHDLGDPDRLALKAELQSGDAVGLNLRLVDSQGEVFQFQSQPLKPGMNELSWDLHQPVGGSWGDNINGKMDPPMRLHELWVSRGPSAQDARVRLVSAEITNSVPVLDAIDVALEAGNAVHVIDAAGGQKPLLKLTNRSLSPARFKLQVGLEDFEGHIIPIDKSCELAPGAEMTCALPRPDKLGIWWVRYTLSDEGETARRSGRLSFALMRPAGPTQGRASGFLFSICTHTERWPLADQEREVLAAALCGAKVIRVGVGFEGIEPVEGEWHWDAMDRIVRMYRESGMEIQYLLGFTPQWAAPLEFRDKGYEVWRGKQPRLDAWRKFVSETARRYKDRIRYWEVWNEPDIGFWTGTLDEYLELLKAAYEEIKAVDPKLHVMTGGFAIYDRNPAFIEGVVARAPHSFDILAWHRHGDFQSFAREVDGPLAALRAKLTPPKPLYFNETAIASVDDTQRQQAEQLFKKLTFAWSRGAIGYTWYDLRNDGFDPRNYEHNYGMLTNDFYPKAVYCAYNTIVSCLRGKRYLGQIELGPDRWGFVFGSSREQVVAAWSDAPGASVEQYVLSTGARHATAVDLMGNASPGSLIVDNKVLMTLSRAPSFLVLEGANSLPKVDAPFMTVPHTTIAVPGRTVTLQAEVYNPFSAPQEFQGTWDLPSDLAPGPLPVHIRLPARSRQTISITIPVPAKIWAGSDAAPAAHLSGHFKDAGWAGMLSAPIYMAALIPSGPADRPADFDLRFPTQLHNLFEADPNKRGMLWKGPDDLSARVWLGRNSGAMTLRAEVTDDVHYQPSKGLDMWQGDSIQLAFEVPGQQGYWELGLSQGPDGKPDICSWLTPKGFADPSAQVQLTTTPLPGGKGLIYEAILPYPTFGMSDAELESGIRFNLLVNDNDGQGRKGWLALAPGIGENKSSAQFPFAVFEKKG